MADKMTNREVLNLIASGNITDEVKNWAKEEISKLDAKNEKRRNTKSKEQVENDSIMTNILNYIRENGAQVASNLGNTFNISTQKASALCKLLVDSGSLIVTDKKIKGKGTVKEYSIPSTIDVVADS